MAVNESSGSVVIRSFVKYVLLVQDDLLRWKWNKLEYAPLLFFCAVAVIRLVLLHSTVDISTKWHRKCSAEV